MTNHDTPNTSDAVPNAVELVDQLGAAWSPDFDAYAEGRIAVSQLRCVLCRTAPCSCTRCPRCEWEQQFCLCDHDTWGRS